jgi:hypothetical protein
MQTLEFSRTGLMCILMLAGARPALAQTAAKKAGVEKIA